MTHENLQVYSYYFIATERYYYLGRSADGLYNFYDDKLKHYSFDDTDLHLAEMIPEPEPVYENDLFENGDAKGVFLESHRGGISG